MDLIRKRPNRERAKLFQKVVFFVREGKKSLEKRNREVDRDRAQSILNFKAKRRELKAKLREFNEEQKKIASNKKQGSSRSSLKSLEPLSQDINERKTALTLRDLKIQGNIETDQDCFPAITCTEVNIPKILKRSISIESETYNWLFGLPNQGTKPASLIAKELRLAKRFTKETKVSQKEEDLKRKRSSRVQKSIVYNVPISLSTESKWKRNFPTHSYSYSEINGMDVQQSQKDSNKLPPVITDNVLGGNLRGKISVKLQNK